MQQQPHVRVSLSLAVSLFLLFIYLFLTLTPGRGVCIAPAHQHKSINIAAAATAADPCVRRSVCPLPHPPSTRDQERHPSSIIRLQRSVRPAQVTTSPKTEREK